MIVGVPDDATLAQGVAAGDSRALAAVYDRYAGRVLAFCEAILGDRQQAQDCLAEVFVIASRQLDELAVPSMLRAWLFAVARNACRARIAARNEARQLMDAGAADTAADPFEPADLADSADEIEPMDLFAEPTDSAESPESLEPLPSTVVEAPDGRPFADRVVLELAERQQLRPAEVAAAIGVPAADAPTIIAHARRADRAAGGALLGPGRAFAAEIVADRQLILATAQSPAASAPSSLIGWNRGWPPSDPALVGAGRRRRWGAPLAVVAVLLLALGAILGLLAVSGGGSSRPTAVVPVALSPTPTVTHSASLSPTGSSTPTYSPVGPAVPPAASAPPTVVSVTPPTPTAAASSGPVNWTLAITTVHAVTITAGRSQVGCGAQSACTYQVLDGTIVTITDDARGVGALQGDTFSAPPNCAKRPGLDSCTFIMTANLSIKISAGISTGPTQRNG